MRLIMGTARRITTLVLLSSGRVNTIGEKFVSAADNFIWQSRCTICSTCFVSSPASRSNADAHFQKATKFELNDHQQFHPAIPSASVVDGLPLVFRRGLHSFCRIEILKYGTLRNNEPAKKYRTLKNNEPATNVMCVPARACSTETELMDSEFSETEDSEIEDMETEDTPPTEPENKSSRPSVTWGVLLTQDQRRLSREVVFEFLKGEGINTSELTEIELPTTVEVMQQRLGFLRKIGLDNKAINNYPLVLGCSVRKNMVPVLKYLGKLGMARPYLSGFLRKYPMILHASVVIDILPVIYFLKGLDIDSKDIPTVLMRYPDILAFKQEGTMSTSVAYLVSIGVDMKAIGGMLTEYPEIMGMRVASVIKPKVEYLMSLGLPKTIVARILERRPQLLGYGLDNRMRYNVDQLLKAGVKQEPIPGVIAQYPEVLGKVFDRNLDSKTQWLVEKVHVIPDDLPRIIEKMPQVLFLKDSLAMERINFLKNARFTGKDIGRMVTNCPQLLVVSIDQALKPNLNFLQRDMKRGLKEVVDFPAYFTYSLETRIRPRYKVITEKGIKCSLAWFLNCTDRKFQKRLESESEEGEDFGPVFHMGGLLPPRVEKDEEEWQLGEEATAASLRGYTTWQKVESGHSRHQEWGRERHEESESEEDSSDGENGLEDSQLQAQEDDEDWSDESELSQFWNNETDEDEVAEGLDKKDQFTGTDDEEDEFTEAGDITDSFDETSDED